MNDFTASMDGKHHGLREWSLAMGVSFLVHAVVAAGIVVASLWFSGGGGGTGVVDVDLVAMFPSSGLSGDGAISVTDETLTSSETETTEPETDVTKKTDEQTETTRTLSTPEKSNAVPLSLKPLEKQETTPDHQPTDKPVDEKAEPDSDRTLNDESFHKVSKSDTMDGQTHLATSGAGNEGAEGAKGGMAAMGDKTDVYLSLDQYRALIRQMIRSNWRFPQNSAGDNQHPETRVAFEVMPNGDIRCVRIERVSGSTFMDEAAMAAIKRSGPVRPHPQGVNRPYVEMVVVFSSSDLY